VKKTSAGELEVSPGQQIITGGEQKISLLSLTTALRSKKNSTTSRYFFMQRGKYLLLFK
jgi:hypothetical protein